MQCGRRCAAFVPVTWLLLTSALFSGTVYSFVTNSPASGIAVDSHGKVLPQAVRSGMNSQYSYEGALTFLLITLGSVGLIIANKASGPTASKGNMRQLLLWGSALLVGGAMVGLRALALQKLPGYMTWGGAWS